MAIELITEAQRERENIELFNTEMSYATTWEERMQIYKKYGRIPKKSIVNDNLKMARRLLVDEYIK